MKLFLKSDGFSLIEILISIVILSISLLALAGLMTITSRNTSFGGHITEAATFAQDQLEQLRVASWGAANSPLRDGAHNNTIRGSAGTGIPYNRNWNVVTNAGGNIIKTITITIDWTDQTVQSFSITSAISNPTQ